MFEKILKSIKVLKRSINLVLIFLLYTILIYLRISLKNLKRNFKRSNLKTFFTSLSIYIKFLTLIPDILNLIHKNQLK